MQPNTEIRDSPVLNTAWVPRFERMWASSASAWQKAESDAFVDQLNRLSVDGFAGEGKGPQVGTDSGADPSAESQWEGRNYLDYARMVLGILPDLLVYHPADLWRQVEKWKSDWRLDDITVFDSLDECSFIESTCVAVMLQLCDVSGRAMVLLVPCEDGSLRLCRVMVGLRS